MKNPNFNNLPLGGSAELNDNPTQARNSFSLLHTGSHSLLWGGSLGVLCLLSLSVLGAPKPVQPEANFLPGTVETFGLLLIHLGTRMAFILSMIGMISTPGVYGGFFPSKLSTATPSPNMRFIAIAALPADLIGCTLGCIFMMVDGFALTDMHLRWTTQASHPLALLYRSIESIRTIDCARLSGTNLFFGGLSPLLLGLGLRSFGGKLTGIARASIIFGGLNIGPGLFHSLIFPTAVLLLPGGGVSTSPYILYFSLNFMSLGLSFAVILWTGAALIKKGAECLLHPERQSPHFQTVVAAPLKKVHL